MTTCQEPGCKRAPAYPDMNRCREHRLRWAPKQPVEPWEPAWLRRARQRPYGLARDETGRAA